MVVAAARDEHGLHGLEPLMDHANAVLAEMVEDGAIRAAERERIVRPAHPKSRRDLLAPFGDGGRFHGLVVEHCEVLPGPDPAWEEYRRDGDAEALAARRARFFRAAFAPAFAASLDEGRPPADRLAFGDRLEGGLVRRVARDPAEMRLVIGTMVIART